MKFYQSPLNMVLFASLKKKWWKNTIYIWHTDTETIHKFKEKYLLILYCSNCSVYIILLRNGTKQFVDIKPYVIWYILLNTTPQSDEEKITKQEIETK